MLKLNHYLKFLIVISILLLSKGAYAYTSVTNSEGLSSCYGMQADKETVKYLLVWDKDGGCVSFPLEERPRIVTDPQLLLVTCTTQKQEITFSLNDVHKYTLDANDQHDASVEEVDENASGFHRNAGSIELYGFKPETRVSVYTVDGVLVCQNIINSDGCITLYTYNWSNGIYLIKIGNTTYKVTKK